MSGDVVIDPINPLWNLLAPVRGVAEVERDEASVMLDSDLGPIRLSAFAPGIFRLRIGDDADRPDYGMLAATPAPENVTISSDEAGWTIIQGTASLSFRPDPPRIELRREDKVILSGVTDRHFVRPQRLPGLARTDDGWFVAFSLDSGEPVYGLGEKWGPLNRRGQFVDSWTHDALGVNGERSYKNCPFAWSPEGWGLFVHTPARVRHGVGYPAWSHRSYGIDVQDNSLDLFLFVGDSPASLLERYTHLTGRMPMPPLWGLGAWISKAYYRTPAEALAAARTMRDRNLPADVLLLDGRAWQDTDTRFAFEWDRSRYDDPKSFIDQLHALGFRVCCWEYPLVSTRSPLFAEMAAKGWLLKDRETGDAHRYQWDHEPFGDVLTPLPESGIVDFTHPGAYGWWRDRHAELFAAGVDAMKPDFGEQVPETAVAANGDSGRRLHNVYPLLYNRCVFEATEQAYPGEAMVFSRAGWTGSQRYPMQWGGDPQSDWQGMAASLRGGLSWGLSGGPCYATDIGGFYGDQPDAELFIRWTQAAVFSSHMRFHGIGPREPWAFGEAAEAIVRQWIELRYRLLPYIRGVLAEASATGLPCQRPMVLAFPDDRAGWAFEDQFMFGRDLLVAPVLKPGGDIRFYLPEGDWMDFATGESHEGGRSLRRTVPLDQLPVFVRRGSPVALGPLVSHTGMIASPGGIEEIKLYGPVERPPVLPEGIEIQVADGRLEGVGEDIRIVEMDGRRTG